MSGFLEALIYALSGTAPYHVTAFCPFWKDRLRFSKRTTLLLIAGAELVGLAGTVLLKRAGVPARMEDFLFLPIFLILMAGCIREPLGKILFFAAQNICLMMTVRGISVVVSTLLSRPAVSYAASLVNLAVAALLLVPAVRLLLRVRERIGSIEAPNVWRTIWLFPALASVIVMLFTRDFSQENVLNPAFLLARIILPVCVFAVGGILLQTLDAIRAQAALKEQAAQQEQIIALQRRQHEYLKQYMEENRQARHDLRQHLRIIEGYLDSGDKAALQDYIRSYQETLPADAAGPAYCKNYALDVVVRYYAQEAEKEGVDFDVRIDLPERLPISEPEFCALVGNLLENAVEACRRAGDEAPYIRMKIVPYSADMIVVVEDNTCGRTPEWEGERLLSAKHGGYGIGTQSIRATAARYHGRAEFTWDEKEFHASVLLQKTD